MWALVGAFGAAGTYARVRVTAGVDRCSGIHFPLGTLTVNIAGGFALGIVYGAHAAPDVVVIAGGGLLGGFTTFSTWMLDTEVLAREVGTAWAALNLVVPALVGLVATAAGWALGRLLVG